MPPIPSYYHLPKFFPYLILLVATLPHLRLVRSTDSLPHRGRCIDDGMYLWNLLPDHFVYALLQGDVRRAAALAAAAEGDVGDALFDAGEADRAAVAGHSGVDDGVEDVLDLLGQGSSQLGLGKKILKPDCMTPSTKSTVAPSSWVALMGSMNTSKSATRKFRSPCWRSSGLTSHSLCSLRVPATRTALTPWPC